MKKNKITLATFAIALTLTPNVFTLDEDGDRIINTLKTEYTNNLMPDKILTSSGIKIWQIIAVGVPNYVKKNYTIAGIADKLLGNSISPLLSLAPKTQEAITNMQRALKYADVRTMNKTLADLTNIKSEIIAIETPLKKEPYYVPSKKNAKEVLLFALEYMRGAVETAIAKIRNELKGIQNI